MALEAPEIFLAVPEMAPATVLEMAPATAPETVLAMVLEMVPTVEISNPEMIFIITNFSLTGRFQ